MDNSSFYSLLTSLSILFILVIVALCVFAIVVKWKIFVKAGKEGWYSIIPVYGNIVLLEIVGLKWYYIFGYCLSCIPVVGSIAAILFVIIISIKFAKSFGKETGFGIGIAFLPVIFEAIVAFDSSIKYVGPAADGDLDFNNLF